MGLKVFKKEALKELTIDPFELKITLHQCLKVTIKGKSEPSENGLSTWLWGKVPVIGGKYLKFAIYNQVGELVVLFIQTGNEILTRSDEWLVLTLQLMLKSCQERHFSVNYHPYWEKNIDNRCGSNLEYYIWYDGENPKKVESVFGGDLFSAYQKLWVK